MCINELTTMDVWASLQAPRLIPQCPGVTRKVNPPMPLKGTRTCNLRVTKPKALRHLSYPLGVMHACMYVYNILHCIYFVRKEFIVMDSLVDVNDNHGSVYQENEMGALQRQQCVGGTRKIFQGRRN